MAVRTTVTVGGVVRDFVAEAKVAKAEGRFPKGASLQVVARMLRDQALSAERKATQEANGVEDDYLFM